MLQKSIVVTAAWLEIVAGATLLTVPNVVCRLLFAATPEGVGMPIGRLAGVALVALGIACLPLRVIEPLPGAVLGLLTYNIGVAILLARVGVTTTLRGAILWPAVILHAVIAAALLAASF
jgi:hypothetical protein